MKKITNLDEVKRELYDMIFELEMDEKDYQTDIYAYYDDETGKVTLEYFENVGETLWYDYGRHYDKLEDEFGFADDDKKEKFHLRIWLYHRSRDWRLKEYKARTAWGWVRGI